MEGTVAKGSRREPQSGCLPMSYHSQRVRPSKLSLWSIRTDARAIMIISILERRSESGLWRTLGATRGHVRIQFLEEPVLVALVGGAAGSALAR